MKRIITIIAALAFSAAFITTAEAKKPKGGKGSPEAAFKKKDTDNDGFLTKAEFTAGAKDAAKAEKQFAKMSKGAEKVSKDDFAAAMANRKKKNK